MILLNFVLKTREYLTLRFLFQRDFSHWRPSSGSIVPWTLNNVTAKTANRRKVGWWHGIEKHEKLDIEFCIFVSENWRKMGVFFTCIIKLIVSDSFEKSWLTRILMIGVLIIRKDHGMNTTGTYTDTELWLKLLFLCLHKLQVNTSCLSKYKLYLLWWISSRRKSSYLFNPWRILPSLFGPHQPNLVLIAYASSALSTS